jgi:translation initiation factor IF-2
MNGSRSTGQQPGSDPAPDPAIPPAPDPAPGPAIPPAPRAAHRSGRWRYVRAFTDDASRRWSTQGLKTKPALLIMILVVTLAVPLAIGAIPMMFKAKPVADAQHATTGTTADPTPTPPGPSPHPSVSRSAHTRPPAQDGTGSGSSRSHATITPPVRQPTTDTHRTSRAARAAARRNAPKPHPSTSPPATKATFWAVTGYGCTQNKTARFSEHGRWNGGLSGFSAVRSGSLTVDGCDGAFDAMPMSGNARKDDRGNYALWTFHTGAVTRGICHIDVFVPNDANIEHVGGNPAFYTVFASARATGQPIASFPIDQHFNRDRWASRGTYRITGGVLTIKLHSRGIDWKGNTQTHAHIAVSPVRVTCET